MLLAASDVVLTTWFIAIPSAGITSAVTWTWYASMLWLGTSLKQNAGALRILGSALAGSVSFFLLSNFAVWAAWNMYPRTVAGLLTCYDAGLPFFRHGVVGDLLFTGVMFASPVIYSALAGWMRKSGDHTAAA